MASVTYSTCIVPLAEEDEDEEEDEEEEVEVEVDVVEMTFNASAVVAVEARSASRRCTSSMLVALLMASCST